MDNRQFRFFQKLCKYSQARLFKEIPLILNKKYNQEELTVTGDYIYAKGDIPIMLVAHLDTVHKQAPREIYYDREKQVIWSPQGIGADDRAGVYGILKLIADGFKPYILFCRDEEIGGLGSKAASKEIEIPKELRYVIQLDRRGFDDCVFYDNDNKDFTSYVEGFGFQENWGSFSDISHLCPEWNISGVNLSIGYYNEHSFSEYLQVHHMETTLRKVSKMLMDKDERCFDYVEGAGYGYGLGYYDIAFGYGHYEKKKDGKEDKKLKKFLADFEKDLEKESPDKGLCYYCFDEIQKDFLIPVEGEGNYCPDCYATHTFTCTECEKAYLKSQQSSFSGVCKSCFTKVNES